MVLRTKHGHINITFERRRSSNELRNEKTRIKQRYSTNARKEHKRKEMEGNSTSSPLFKYSVPFHLDPIEYY